MLRLLKILNCSRQKVVLKNIFSFSILIFGIYEAKQTSVESPQRLLLCLDAAVPDVIPSLNALGAKHFIMHYSLKS